MKSHTSFATPKSTRPKSFAHREACCAYLTHISHVSLLCVVFMNIIMFTWLCYCNFDHFGRCFINLFCFFWCLLTSEMDLGYFVVLIVMIQDGRAQNGPRWLCSWDNVCHVQPVSVIPCPREHDDVIKWKHFPRYWPFLMGLHRWPVESRHKGKWRRALVFSLICSWSNGSTNNLDAGDLKCPRAHYDVTVMSKVKTRTQEGDEIEKIKYRYARYLSLLARQTSGMSVLVTYSVVICQNQTSEKCTCHVVNTISPMSFLISEFQERDSLTKHGTV